LQLLAHPETREWFSVTSVIIFKVIIVAAQKQALLVNIFLFFKASISLNAFTAPALPLFRRPWKRGKNFSLWFANLCLI